ncbi:putative glutamate carboxypeptidase [Hyphodiscus hymeniophilus]|uniref:Glutamate carboxypeptidase n=1 Tax=Hyphodiscus hymeniophilus TaxID=353542 RepID=A0A9P6VLP8_9HELO|nr:putative glutamate carboxypeptidase [Hyphodiscus hymeniophilus]
MPDEKPNKYEPLPIPTYEEAIGSSSRTTTPTPSRSTDEAAHPAEREGLLGHLDPGGRLPVPTRRAGYRPPPTEDSASVRGSLEQHDAFLGQDRERRRDSASTEDEEVRREMEEMEMMDPPRPQTAWGKRMSSLTASLSSLNLPFKWRPGWRWPRVDANFCIVLGRCFAVLLVMAVVYLLFMSGIFTSNLQRMAGQMFDPEDVRVHVQKEVDERRIGERLREITMADHLAGTEGDYVLAQYVEGIFASVGLEDVHMEEFGVYLNYPKEGGRKVDLLKDDGNVAWSAKIDEDPVYSDPPRAQTPVFHGHSRTGDVVGPLIYANYGSREDFRRLHDSGIATEGAIALVKYGGTQGDRALKVKAAELVGFAGCIIYSDPADDGFTKGEVAPNGRYMPESGVQRGAVSLMSWVVGDVLTPGWASVKGAERVSKDNNPGLVNIPSLPLSWGDAQHLLQAIKGFGQRAPDEWKGAIPNIEYWSGNSSSPKVHLVNDQDESDEQSIWNVMAKVTGIEQGEKAIIVGNHRDAWAYGATDPGSGTAVMLEVASIFGDLMARGWRPLRTIQFASWDAEEYNLIGSTEYVEANMEKLRADAFAYLNVDVAVGGQNFVAAGSPVFQKSLLRVLDRTSDSSQNVTLRELWDRRGAKLGGLGAGSDYVAFQDMAGTSSLDFGFDGPPFPYHSAYDNFEWMINVGDPGLQYHKVLAQVWALLILEFSDRLMLPFDMSAYSSSLTGWAMDLENWAKSKGANQAGQTPWSTEPLREAVLQFAKDAKQFEEFELEWDSVVLGGGGFENANVAFHRKSHNIRMANFETHLLDLEEGGGVCIFVLANDCPLILKSQIPNRTQFKHVVFGPQLWSGYDEAYFPFIRDAVEAGDWTLAQKQVEKAAAIIKRASAKLIGN